MSDVLINRRDLTFLLYDLLDTEGLTHRSHFNDHSRETFESAIDTAESIASRLFAPHNATADAHEPQFDGQSVSLIPEVKIAADALADAGFIAAKEDYEDGGMQLPESVSAVCMSLFTAANPSTAGYSFLTSAAAKVIKKFADDELKKLFLPSMLSGKFSGTMALTEPQAGSSLADITTTAFVQEDGTYKIKGNKIYISGGDQSITENIVHLVLAKIEGAPLGTKGISLFLVPKYLLDNEGKSSVKNDVALAGLFHKMGYRGTTSTALNFGEQDNCTGYLIGKPHQGLKLMFQMMNEARLAVGFGAAVIGYRGYQHSLQYAKERPQGRPVSESDPSSAQVPIIHHADVKRMLLAQKAYVEGGLALCLFGARLVDDSETSESDSQRLESFQLLDLLTPIMKAWPSEFGVRANDLAIQVLGGAGYIREYPVEQCFRDNRLNPIHEGTNGIQGLDLLGRKIWQNNGAAVQKLGAMMLKTIQSSPKDFESMCSKLTENVSEMQRVIELLSIKIKEKPNETLALATPFLKFMGHSVVGWMWLQQANKAHQLLNKDATDEEFRFLQGKIQTAKYFFNVELPKVDVDLKLLKDFDMSFVEMKATWF